MGLPSEEEANKQAKAFLDILLPLQAAIVKMLVEKNANFPEKV